MNSIPSKPSVAAFTSISTLLDRLCKPNPLSIPNKIEHEVTYKRNKAIFIGKTIMLTLCLLEMTLCEDRFVINLLRCSSCVTIMSFVILACRYNPQVFNIFYSVCCILHGPTMIASGQEGIHVGFIGAIAIPICVYLFTGSIWHFLFQTIGQMIYLNTFYQSLMIETVAAKGPEAFTAALTSVFNLNIVVQMVFVILNEHFIRQAYKRVVIAEKERDEIERQKTFLLGFSHELRNLVNSLSGNIKLASLENLTTKAKEFLTNADVCSELLLHLISNILDTGKAEIGDLDITPAPVRTYDCLEKTWRICTELIRRKALRGHINIRKDLPKLVMVDQHRLDQIMLNLVDNATKFTNSGRVEISVEWLSNTGIVSDKTFEPYPFSEDDQDEGLFEKAQSMAHFNSLTLTTNFGVLSGNFVPKTNHVTKGVIKIVV